jgi:ferredoxin
MAEARTDFVRTESGFERTVGSVAFVEPNLNLLAHAQTLELEVGSRCGGHGICGGDRVRVRDRDAALSPITDAERRHLTKKEIAEGYRLACQCFPNNPEVSLRVEILPD